MRRFLVGICLLFTVSVMTGAVFAGDGLACQTSTDGVSVMGYADAGTDTGVVVDNPVADNPVVTMALHAIASFIATACGAPETLVYLMLTLFLGMLYRYLQSLVRTNVTPVGTPRRDFWAGVTGFLFGSHTVAENRRLPVLATPEQIKSERQRQIESLRGKYPLLAIDIAELRRKHS